MLNFGKRKEPRNYPLSSSSIAEMLIRHPAVNRQVPPLHLRSADSASSASEHQQPIRSSMPWFVCVLKAFMLIGSHAGNSETTSLQRFMTLTP